MPGQESPNLEMLSDLATPWSIRVAVTLGIAEQLASGNGRIAGLARAVKCNAEVLHAVLSHLVSKGIFEEPEPGRFALNEPARALLDPAMRLGLDLEGIGGRMAHAWGTLLSYVRTGAPAYHEVFGRPFWEDLEAHPAIAASFDELIGPSGHGHFSAEFAISGGWDSVRTIVDVGGGTGAMLAAMLQAHPQLRGTLVDLPGTVGRSAATFESAGVADRVTLAGQSFFDPLPPGADLYLLRGVLNDWPDREAAAILYGCAQAARPNGRVVVLKSVGPDSAPKRLEIEMVLLGGKPRTVAEFSKLAKGCGLEVISAGRQESGYFVVECRPV